MSVSALGSPDTRLIVVRGNSGCGKSTLAAAVRAARPRGVAVIGQDQLRREILHVHDQPGTPAADYMDLSARFTLSRGLHTLVEGILYEEIYGDILRGLIRDHRGITRCYRYDVPFAETVRRHASKASALDFGETEMAAWWRDADQLTGVDETVLGPESTVHDSLHRVLSDCGW